LYGSAGIVIWWRKHGQGKAAQVVEATVSTIKVPELPWVWTF